MKKVNTKEIENTVIGIYRRINDKQGKFIYFKDFFEKCIPASKDIICELRSITAETYKEKHKKQQDFKLENIPVATISCLCGYSKKQIIKRNDLIVLDIDPGDNQTMFDDEQLNDIKHKLFALPFVYAVALSASGKGLFVVIPISNTNQEMFEGYFRALEQDFKEQYNVSIDQNCKNVNRLRYFSYDDNMLIKHDQDIEYYEKVILEQQPEKQEVNKDLQQKIENSFNNSDDLIYDDKFVYQTVKTLIDRGFSADDYRTWMIQGMMLGTLGEMGKLLFNELSINSGNYTGYDDVCRQFNICSDKTNKTRKEAVTYYFGIAKKMIGKNWIETVKLTKI